MARTTLLHQDRHPALEDLHPTHRNGMDKDGRAILRLEMDTKMDMITDLETEIHVEHLVEEHLEATNNLLSQMTVASRQEDTVELEVHPREEAILRPETHIINKVDLEVHQEDMREDHLKIIHNLFLQTAVASNVDSKVAKEVHSKVEEIFKEEMESANREGLDLHQEVLKGDQEVFPGSKEGLLIQQVEEAGIQTVIKEELIIKEDLEEEVEIRVELRMGLSNAEDFLAQQQEIRGLRIKMESSLKTDSLV
ncbi:uncharacterized protein LOC129226479 [Uloborus diversus]|uniref:uncharacterized protein LOC129226479 n=1 Tax=Uloborus diversus TaxID=327109 RepID=UPI00240A3A18|nr:uncharacterized protein LOC129226479 [Uloborus diversus]